MFDASWSRREVISIISAQNVHVEDTLQADRRITFPREKANKESYKVG